MAFERLFGNRINPECRYCRYGKVSTNKEKVFCSKKGVVNANNRCRSYEYDPTLREPKKIMANMEYTKEDFSID